VHKGADYPLLNTPELFQTVSENYNYQNHYNL
jgi:hypothetical protein